MSKRAQPAWLADAAEKRRAAREQRTPELLALRNTLALERIAEALERLAIVPLPDPMGRVAIRTAVRRGT